MLEFAKQIMRELQPQRKAIVLQKQTQLVYRVTTNEVQYLKIVKRNRIQEIELLQQFNCTPRVLQTFYSVEYAGFTMRNAGDSISSILKSRRFDFQEFIQVFKSLVECLMEIHEKGYVHLDINPGNICIWDGRVQLIDFGLTEKMIDGVLSGGYRFGLPRYKAPEIKKQGPPIDESVDYYAFGKITLEITAKGMIGANHEQSEKLLSLVGQITKENPNERITGIELLNRLAEIY
ncbi:hypothetical protein HDV01_006823 [Terramyces sp. JEL0728]|nr:hypothetical protein HDV01_006823 [Terramyces sp. JEL0728]